MWRYESLMLLYAVTGLAAWTWIIRNHHPRVRQRARGIEVLRRRQRNVERLGLCVIALVGLLAVVAGLVDTRGLAFVLALFVAIAQLLMVFAFQNTRTAEMEHPLIDENR
jgi:TRAP-type C4-dicarboxylate transport system permease large subunit